MPNIQDSFPSKYLKAGDLKEQDVTVKIDRVDFEQIGSDRKAVLYFIGKNKGLVLNKTNANKITDIAGSALTEDWHGVDIVLYPTETSFQGDTVDCIRIRGAKRGMGLTRTAPKPEPPTTERVHDEMGDDPIPF